MPPDSTARVSPPSDSPADEIARLRESVAHHNRLYHELDSPELPDVEFDLLVRRLRELEEQHPDLAGGPTPTSTVGGAARLRVRAIYIDRS